MYKSNKNDSILTQTDKDRPTNMRFYDEPGLGQGLSAVHKDITDVKFPISHA